MQAGVQHNFIDIALAAMGKSAKDGDEQARKQSEDVIYSVYQWQTQYCTTAVAAYHVSRHLQGWHQWMWPEAGSGQRALSGLRPACWCDQQWLLSCPSLRRPIWGQGHWPSDRDRCGWHPHGTLWQKQQRSPGLYQIGQTLLQLILQYQYHKITAQQFSALPSQQLPKTRVSCLDIPLLISPSIIWSKAANDLFQCRLGSQNRLLVVDCGMTAHPHGLMQWCRRRGRLLQVRFEL